MDGLYRRCIVYFCFVLICSVTAENDTDARQEDAHFETTTATTTTNVNTDVSVSEELYTSTSENPHSEMTNSASVKKDADLLMSMPGNSRPRNAILSPGRKRQLSGHTGQDGDDQHLSAPGGSEESGQRDNLEGVQQRDYLKDVQHRGNLKDAQHRGSPEDIQQRDSLEDIQQKGNPEEIGQRYALEDTQQRSNLTENEVYQNKTMQEIIDSLNGENKTLIGSDILNLDSVSPVVTTLQTTEGYTRKRWPPRPLQPRKNSPADLHAEKMQSQANSCSMPVWLMCLLCLCWWTF